jgi:hypothetical protein
LWIFVRFGLIRSDVEHGEGVVVVAAGVGDVGASREPERVDRQVTC